MSIYNIPSENLELVKLYQVPKSSRTQKFDGMPIDINLRHWYIVSLFKEVNNWRYYLLTKYQMEDFEEASPNSYDIFLHFKLEVPNNFGAITRIRLNCRYYGHDWFFIDNRLFNIHKFDQGLIFPVINTGNLIR